ncbi:site-specific DNA-methyltransferase [bacterium]|nr:site-specific DNA-methyltransferase [bacterium]
MSRNKHNHSDSLYLPGFDPPSKNGTNGRTPKLLLASAEKTVPRELEVELNIRKWHETTKYQGPWHNTIHHGDNMITMKQMPDETVDLFLTDPPYNINYRSHRRKKQPKFKHLHNDNNGNWIPDFVKEAYRVLKDDRHIYCFCRHDTYPEFVDAFLDAGFKLKRTLIWVKNNHGSGDLKGDYAPQDEWIIYAHKGRRPLNGKRTSNILTFSKLHSTKMVHSTEKPVKLLKFLIGKSTYEGELVMDPFAGSGSTMHAAIEMQRSYCVIELSEEYYFTTEERKRDLNQTGFEDSLYGLDGKEE